MLYFLPSTHIPCFLMTSFWLLRFSSNCFKFDLIKKRRKNLKRTLAKAPSLMQSHFSYYSSIYSKMMAIMQVHWDLIYLCLFWRAFKIIQSLLYKTSNMHYCLHAQTFSFLSMIRNDHCNISYYNFCSLIIWPDLLKSPLTFSLYNSQLQGGK